MGGARRLGGWAPGSKFYFKLIHGDFSFEKFDELEADDETTTH
jgi:hypothetical protein